jgi:hypothetical protein
MGSGGAARALAVCVFLSTACGGGGGYTVTRPVISPAEADFIIQYCDVYSPCCAAAGRSADGQSCRYRISNSPGSYLAYTYDPAAGEACLNALKVAASQPDFCADTASRPSECDRALGVTGTTAPGGDCRSARDCAPSAEGHVVCVQSARISGTTSTCEVEIRGQAGDGPCIYTVTPSSVRVIAGVLSDTPPRGFLCYMSDGLYCDDSGQCMPLKPIGEACRGESCVTGAYCRALICAAPLPAEAACEPFVDGCVDGWYCDSSTSTCQPLGATGWGCDYAYQCQSGSCTYQTCDALPDALSLFCAPSN